MTTRRLTRRTFAAGMGAAALAGLSPARAQQAITRLVVAFPPGGPVDMVARVLQEPLAKELGHQVIVENRPGANGAIAASYVAKAAPDGTTLWLTSVGAVAINPSLYEKLTYDPVHDLAPVSGVVNNVEVLVVPANAPYKTGAEFVAAARKRAGKPMTMASSGTGSVPHLAMELLRDAARIDLMHVPYKGAAPAITDVIAGHVDGFFGDIPGLLPHIQSGKVKAIALAATQRHPALPDVKTFAEMGVPGVDSDNWYALFGPKGLPAMEVARVNLAVQRALQREDVRQRLITSGAEPAPSSPVQLAALLKKDTEKWARVIKAKNIKPD